MQENPRTTRVDVLWRALVQLRRARYEEEETMLSLRHPEPLARDPLNVVGVA